MLIAEDEYFVAEGHRVFLQSNYGDGDIDFARNGREMVEMASRKRYDLVISDCGMPEMTGIQALRELQARGIDARVLVISGSDSLENVDEAWEAGAHGFVSKNAHTSILKEATDRFLGKYSK